jgi:hypothetical protein
MSILSRCPAHGSGYRCWTAERDFLDDPDDKEAKFSRPPKKYPAAKGGKHWPHMPVLGLSTLKIPGNAFFSTRSTELHQSAALTLRSGSA